MTNGNKYGRHGAPIPEDFVKWSEQMTQKQLAKKYGVSAATTDRWRTATGQKIGDGVRHPRKVFWMVENGCWRCTSHKGEYPEGRANGKYYKVVKRLWVEKNGEWPDKKYILHSCDNRWCINPNHVRPGTLKENLQDAYDRRRNTYGERHPCSKLSIDQVIWANKHKGKLSYAYMARICGVEQSTMWTACNNGWRRALEDVGR